MGCQCAKGRPTVKVMINHTSERSEQNSINSEEPKNINQEFSKGKNKRSSLLDSKGKKFTINSESNLIRVKRKKNNDNSSNNSDHDPPNFANLSLNHKPRTVQVQNSNSFVTSLPSFNEYNNITIEPAPRHNTLLLNNMPNQNCFYIDYFTKQKVELNIGRTYNRCNNNTNKLSISNSSLSYDHTPSFSEDNSSNCKGIVNVTNITNINITPVFVDNKSKKASSKV